MKPVFNNRFASPHENEIMKLEEQYNKALAEGQVFEVLKNIREKIKILKSQLNLQREKLTNIRTEK